MEIFMTRNGYTLKGLGAVWLHADGHAQNITPKPCRIHTMQSYVEHAQNSGICSGAVLQMHCGVVPVGRRR